MAMEAAHKEEVQEAHCCRHDRGEIAAERGYRGEFRGGWVPPSRCRRGAAGWASRLACCVMAAVLLACVSAAGDTNYYKLLGVRKTADTATIKRAYKEMAKKYHPDKHKGLSPIKMEDLNRAHEVLTDPDLRKRYDMYGKDPEDQSVQRAEEQRVRQHEYAQFHNIFSGGKRNHQYIDSQTQTLTAHNYEVIGRLHAPPSPLTSRCLIVPSTSGRWAPCPVSLSTDIVL